MTTKLEGIVSCSSIKIVVNICKLSDVWSGFVEILGFPLILCLVACFMPEK